MSLNNIRGNMNFQHLFNSSGEWIAFRQGPDVFDERCNWVGWLPWSDNAVATQEGEYLGTIVETNRFYYLSDRPHRSHPGPSAYAIYPAYPVRPESMPHVALPVGARDIARFKKKSRSGSTH
jgi:hypothetical protein